MIKPIRALLVEDSVDDAILIERSMIKYGFEPSIQRVDSKPALKEALVSGHWDVIITDHNLPGMNSISALEMVKHLTPDVPVIIVSGAIGEEIAVSAMKAGAQDYIMKTNLARLAPAIERELRDAEIRREHQRDRIAIEHMAWHDALTGLSNRFEFERRARLALETAQRGQKHAMLFLDLDQFKIVNDTCGHSAGDELLCQISRLFNEPVRETDCLARLGGDEFGVLLENCTQEEALQVADRLLRLIGDFRFVWHDRQFNIGVSIGLVPIDQEDLTLEDVLRHADMACYAAKEHGRNRVHVFTAEDQELQQRHGQMEWVGRIHQALEHDEFILYRQRIIDLSNQQTYGYEYLLRMRSEPSEVIPPGAFLPAAERFGLMPAIDRWVLQHAFTHLAASKAEDGIAFINLSGATVSDERFLVFVRDLLEQHQIDAARICFEITETAVIANLAAAIGFITSVRQLGARVALDDFGTGLSSFSYLKHLPADYLKIDGSFVRDMLEDPLDSEIVKSIHNISREAGIKTIAEFVENEAIRFRLQEVGVNYAQGYGIHKPAPFQESLMP